MKNFKLSLAYLAVFAMIFTSCSKEENAQDTDENSVVLTFGAVLNDLANRASKQSQFDLIPTCSDAAPDRAVIGLTVDGDEWEDVDVDILMDSNGYFTAYTEDLKIHVPSAAGVDIVVTSFMVYDAGNNLIWVAPTGGGFAGYVDNPLPLEFNLQRGTKPYIDIEVLCFDRRTVNEYGYPFFDLVPTVVYPLCFFANYCPTPDGRHYVGNYSLDLWYDDGDTRIQIYNDEMPSVGMAGSEYQARPVCLVVPGAPEGFGPNDDYLFYVITPLDWPGNYGDINNAPMAEVGLSWNDVNALLNADGETSEYLHVFIGCEEGNGGPGGDDGDGDGVDDDDDNCPTVPNPLQEDADGDGYGDVCDNCPNVYNPNQMDSDNDGIGNACEDLPGDGDDCETAYMFGNVELNDHYNGNNWGWGLDFNQSGSWDDAYWVASGEYYEFPLWAAAAQNDTSKGRLDGVVRVTLDGTNVHVQIIPDEGVSIYESHVFFGEGNWPVSRAPGQFTYNYNMSQSDDMHTYSYSGDGSFRLIVHAVTCD